MKKRKREKKKKLYGYKYVLCIEYNRLKYIQMAFIMNLVT